MARTVPSTRRLLDVVEAFAGDFRVQVTYAHDPGSAVGAGVLELLASRGIRPIPFEDATRRRWALALAASANSPLDRLDAPVLVVPHGVGHGKGMSVDRLVRDGAVVADAIGLAHADDAARLARLSPAAGKAARVIGDPCWDRLAASRHRRALYREAFGLGGARLLVLSSTWGPGSLFGRHPDLAARLTAELPWDDWRVALVLHPAVRAEHGEQTVRSWLRPALDRGLILLDPDDEWRAALAAADAVVGDHGSVTLYAASLGVPTAFACFGWAEVDPDAVISSLAREGSVFVVDQPGLPQIQRLACSSDQTALANRVFSHHGSALDRIATIAYELMGLSRPTYRPTPIAVPAPRKPHPAPMSWWFRAAISDHDITIARWPAQQPGTRLLAHVYDPDPRLPATATVLIGTTDLAAHPDAYVAADGLRLAVRDHGTVHAEPGSALDPALIAAAVHAWTHQAHRPLGRELRVNRTVVRFEASTRR